MNLNFAQEVQPPQSETQVDLGNDSNLTQRAYLNTLAGLLYYAARLTVGFVVNPILVTGLGSNLFGILQILRRSLTFMTAADGRPTQALKWAIANQQRSDDHVAKRRSIGSALGVWLIFLPVLVTFGAIMVWFSPLITQVPTEQYLLVRVTSALLVMNLLLFGIVNLPDAVLRGMNLHYKRTIVMVCIPIANGILTVGAIYLGFGLAGVAAVPLIISVMSAIVFWGTIRWYVPWFGIARPTLAEIRHFFSLSGWYFAWTLVNKIMLSSDVVVLGFVATAESVTLYTLTGYVAHRIVGILAMIVGAVIPGLGGLIGKKQYDQAATVRGEMMAVNWLLTMSIGVSILLWNRSFVGLWVGMVHYAGSLVNLLYILVATQLFFIRSDAFVIDLTLDIRRKVVLGGLSTLLCIVLAAVLIKPLGIMGLCLGLIAGRSILTVAFPLLIGSALEISPKVRLASLVRPGVVMAGTFALSSYLGHHLLASTWIEFFTWAGLTFVFAVCIGFVGGLTSEQRKAMINRFSKVRLFGRA